MIDPEAGAVLCNVCFSEGNGDGFAAIQKATGCDFPAAVRMVADYLGANHANGDGAKASSKPKKPASEATLTKGLEPIASTSHATLLEMYARAKPPISAAGIGQCHGALVRWNGFRCIRLDGRTPIDRPEATAVVLCRVEGTTFPAFGKVAERKTHTIKGSINSWLVSGDVTTASVILDVEGVTDLLAAVSAGLPADYVAVTNTAGAKARGKLPREWAAGKKIIVAGDADNPGIDGQRRAAAAYHEAGAADVLLAKLPYPTDKDHGKDLRDWLNEQHKIADLPTVAVAAEEAETWFKRLSHSSDKPLIVVTPDEESVANEAIRALSARTDVYQRGGILVHVVRDQEPPSGIVRPKGSPRIVGLSRPTLRERMASSAVWARPAKEDELELCHVPEWAVKAVDSRGMWQDIRQLEVVTETPLFRADGTILQSPGYDMSSGILYEPATEFPAVEDRPSLDDARRSVKELREVWVDVPFGSDTDFAVVIALTLTPLARHSFRGPAPLFAIESNTQGAGKTLTADASGIIATGRPLARASAPPDNEEARKLITSVVMAGERMILLDNIGEMFGWPALDAALTGTTWSDRILGANRMLIDAPLATVWVVTGNNIMFRADVVRQNAIVPAGILGGMPGGAKRVPASRPARLGHRQPRQTRFRRPYHPARLPCSRTAADGAEANGQL